MWGGGKVGDRYRIGFLNVQGLTVAKSVERRNLLMGDNMERGDKNVIVGLVETHEKYRKVDWGRG